VSFAAHQLRTPLTTLKLTTELIIERRKKIDPGMKETIFNLKRDIDNMDKLVDTFLNVARIQSGRLNIVPEVEDVKALLRDVISQSNTIATEKGVSIEEEFQEALPFIKIDQNSFYIIMENYITNAIKYSPPNMSVVVSAKITGKDLEIEVTNGGVGIAKADHPKIFNQMFRASNTGEIEGSGIGLYLVRLIAKQCGGKVWFESPAPRYKSDPGNHGSAFYFSLPISGMKRRKN
jgi:signal transduction histidine kinase